MDHSIEILLELKQISPFLSEMKKVNVFSVPPGYFTNLDQQILENTLTHSTLSLTSETHNRDVPAGYFENLAGNILEKIKKLQVTEPDELIEQYPLLYSLRKENIFTVPENYFEKLPEEVLGALNQGKVRTIGKTRSLWNYAVAATVTGLIAISSLLVTNTSSDNAAQNGMAKNTVPEYIQDSYQYKNEEAINEGIKELSSDDIIKYLEATANDTDNEAFASGVTEKGLPDQEEYLKNEKTLDTYLNQN